MGTQITYAVLFWCEASKAFIGDNEFSQLNFREAQIALALLQHASCRRKWIIVMNDSVVCAGNCSESSS